MGLPERNYAFLLFSIIQQFDYVFRWMGASLNLSDMLVDTVPSSFLLSPAIYSCLIDLLLPS